MRRTTMLLAILLLSAARCAQLPLRAQTLPTHSLPTGVTEGDTVAFNASNSYMPHTAREVQLYRQFAQNTAWSVAYVRGYSIGCENVNVILVQVHDSASLRDLYETFGDEDVFDIFYPARYALQDYGLTGYYQCYADPRRLNQAPPKVRVDMPGDSTHRQEEQPDFRYVCPVFISDFNKTGIIYFTYSQQQLEAVQRYEDDKSDGRITYPVVMQAVKKAMSPHHLGAGVSFNVLDGHPIGNNFVNNVNRISDSYNVGNSLVLSLNKTVSFSVYGEYQYDLTRWLTLAMRIQYHQSNMQYRLFYSTYGNRGINYLDCTLHYLEAPLFANWKFFRRPHFGIFASAGTGLSIAYGATHRYNWSTDVMNSDKSSSLGTAGFSIANDVDQTFLWQLALGAEYELPKGHKLAATATLTMNQSQYKYEMHVVNDIYSSTFRQHDLRLGVTYFF